MFNSSLIDSILNRFVDSGAETGAAAVVMKDGEMLYRGCSGLADADAGTPFTADTVCRAFSCSKVITSTAVMQLLERGELLLDNRLEWYFPEFAGACLVRDGKRVPAARAVTVRDLLNMTSGIPYPGDGREGGSEISELWGRLDKSCREGGSMTAADLAREAGKCALVFEPGAEWCYGSSADILVGVVEVITGKSYADYLRENIFSPLGMDDTGFCCPPEKRDRFAVLYDGAGRNRKPLEWVNLCIYDYDKEPAFQSGGAGIFTTANDLAKLGAALSNGEYKGVKLLGRKTLQFLQQNGLTPEQRKTFNWDSCRGFGYANLMRMLEDPNASGLLASKGSFGWDGWTGTFILNDPAERLSTVLFLQRAGAGTTDLARTVVNAVYSQL